ncbi:MAG: hypothetical protein JO187_07245 [Acidobacteria bacterium]|nr:hypothetical protein [Acidobacteriota bacterium]
MTRGKSDGIGIASMCGEPDPLTCYEHSDEEPCRSCPVVSWLSALAFSGSYADQNIELEDLVVAGR